MVCSNNKIMFKVIRRALKKIGTVFWQGGKNLSLEHFLFVKTQFILHSLGYITMYGFRSLSQKKEWTLKLKVVEVHNNMPAQS